MKNSFLVNLASLLFVLTPVSGLANFAVDSPSKAGFPNTLGGKDFFVTRSSATQRPFLLIEKENCRDRIAKVVCLVDPTEEGQKNTDRECQSGSGAYAIHFERLYDNFPPVMQKMFCSLDYLFIEKSFFGTAYAGQATDESGKSTGAMMGIRQSVLDENLGLATWASWKEQLSFGGVTDAYQPRPELPNIRTHSETAANDFLYFVVAHEFGHLFDFANGINKTKNCSAPKPGEEVGECEMHEDSWGAISWITDQTPKLENEFLTRRSLCFYWCDGKPMTQAQVPRTYADLAQTDFISIYATTQPWDDFADSLAYYLGAQEIGITYEIDTRQGPKYDIISKLRSPLFEKKNSYIRHFLSRQDLIYP